MSTADLDKLRLMVGAITDPDVRQTVFRLVDMVAALETRLAVVEQLVMRLDNRTQNL